MVDTCAILMLIRIAPDMFVDDNFGCVTIRSIRDEFVRTPKFKDKYPWRKDYFSSINPLGSSHEKGEDAEQYKKVIDRSIFEGVQNSKKGKLFDLSREDRELLSWALALERYIVSGDSDIGDYGKQEFGTLFLGEISALEILNDWIEKGLIKWDETKQLYLQDWALNEEAPQPIKEIARFFSLTTFNYVGS